MAHSSNRVSAVVQRYRDAYRVGHTIVAIGNVIKVVGFVLAAAILLLSLLGGAALGQRSGSAAFGSLLFGGVVAGTVGLLFWLLGVLISSQGQVLLASLDVAVNGSPFITDDDRAAAMSLPRDEHVAERMPGTAAAGTTVEAAKSAPARQPKIQPGESTIICPQCATVNPASQFYCANCKRNLHM